MDSSHKKELLPLTSLRFFAAAIVVLAHLGYDYHLGGMGVTFFFILSGFILSYNYASKFTNWNGRELVRMWVSRLSRIFPVHLFTLLLSVPLAYIYLREYSFTDTLSNVFLLQSWYPNGQDVFSYNGVSWTLSCELFFYITLPFVLLAVSKRAIKLRTQHLIRWMVFIMLLIWITSFSAGKDIPEYSFKWWFYVISPYLRWLDFAFGIVLGFVFLRQCDRNRKGFYLGGTLEVCSILVIILFYNIFIKNEVPYKWNYSAYFNILFAVVIYTFSFQKGIVSKILSLNAFTYLGRISFCIYMTHQVLIFYWNRYIFSLSYVEITPWHIANQITYAMVVLVVSSLTYHFIENPSRKAIHHLSLKFS